MLVYHRPTFGKLSVLTSPNCHLIIVRRISIAKLLLKHRSSVLDMSFHCRYIVILWFHYCVDVVQFMIVSLYNVQRKVYDCPIVPAILCEFVTTCYFLSNFKSAFNNVLIDKKLKGCQYYLWHLLRGRTIYLFLFLFFFVILQLAFTFFVSSSNLNQYMKLCFADAI